MAEPIPKPHAANWIAPTVFAAILFIALLAFVLAYPTVFHALESSAPDKFAERVSLALANNDPPRAVAIAREAVRVQPFDAMAHTTLGRALLADGQEAAGIAALEAATKIDSTPGPEYMPTRRLYYFAPARLELARLAMDRGDPNEALAHLALAQVHADLEDQTEYQSLLASLKSPFEGGRLFSEEPGGMWSGINAMPQGSGITPGWIDVAREWYVLRHEVAATIEVRGSENALIVRNDDINKMALFYSIPIPAQPDTRYTLTGEMLAPNTPGVAGWQALDANERVIAEGWLFDQERTSEWTTRELTIETNYFYAELRAVLGVTRHTGESRFANVQIAPSD